MFPTLGVTDVDTYITVQKDQFIITQHSDFSSHSVGSVLLLDTSANNL